MHSPRNVRFLLRALVVAAIACMDVSGRQLSPSGPEAGPSEERVSRSLDALNADPNLATERTIKTLQWKPSDDERRSNRPAWLEWVMGLFQWIEQSARLLIWVAAALLAGFLVVYLNRLVRGRRPGDDHASAANAPTHVRDLDIRPETLPHDIGAASRALWDRGEERAALALLYRGMLSRLAHVHRVPIRDSSTEGDCLALAAVHLSQDRQGYTFRLVRVWQRSVYGREPVVTATVHSLCDEFSVAFDGTARSDRFSEGAA